MRKVKGMCKNILCELINNKKYIYNKYVNSSSKKSMMINDNI